MSIVSFVFKLIVGLALGGIAAFALSPAFAAFNSEKGTNGAALLIVYVLIVLFCLFAPTVRRAFGRGFLIAGVSFLLLPISTLILSGSVTSEMVTTATETGSDGSAEFVGGALVAGVMTGASAFFGFILGAVFIIAGLVFALGGRREVIVVDTRQS